MHSNIVDFWFFPASLILDWDVLLLPLSESFMCWMLPEVFLLCTYFNQVYDDNRWWISRYLTFRKWGTTSWFALVYILPNPTILPQPYLLMVKYSWSRSNSQMTLMEMTVSSPFLSQRHTMATTSYDTLLPVTLKCVFNPIKTSTIRKNNIRKTKTDVIDAYTIAKTLMMLLM